jgi:hypothetical protein
MYAVVLALLEEIQWSDEERVHLFCTRERNERVYDSDAESLAPQAEGIQSYTGNC